MFLKLSSSKCLEHSFERDVSSLAGLLSVTLVTHFWSRILSEGNVKRVTAFSQSADCTGVLSQPAAVHLSGNDCTRGSVPMMPFACNIYGIPIQ